MKALQLAAINGGRDGMLIAPSHSMLRRNVLDRFEAMARPLIVASNKQERWYRLVNGSTVWWGSTDRPETLDGTNLAWYAWDEPRYSPPEAQDIMVARLRDDGAALRQGIYTTTPPPGGWVRDTFDRDVVDQLDIKVSTRENFFLPRDYVEMLERRYSARQCAAYIEGEWTSIENGVFPEFDRKAHVIDYQPDPAVPVLYGLDFGQKWQHVVFAQYYEHGGSSWNRIFPPGSLVVFDELAPGNVTTEELCRRACRMFPANSALPLSWGACDPAGSTSSSTASEHASQLDAIAWKNEMKEQGYNKPKLKYLWGPGTGLWRQVHTGIEAMRGLLQDARGVSRLFFSSSLLKDPSGRGIVRGMEGLVYKRGTSKILRGDAGGQLVHGVDSLRYLVRHLLLSKHGGVSSSQAA
jgi:hypothetical protein